MGRVAASPPVTAPGCWSRWTRPKCTPGGPLGGRPRPPDRGGTPAPPVAVVFSGLQSFRDRLAGAGAYASRLPVEELSNLEPSAARLALVEPAARRHVAWEDEALSLLVRRSAGHPYYVQLFGWQPGRRPKEKPRSPSPTPKPGLNRLEPSLRASTK